MEEMQRQIQDFVGYIQREVMARAHPPQPGALVPIRRPMPIVEDNDAGRPSPRKK
jgi:hypothetical protein